ncbi:MAG TPA: HAD-IIIC family phosphatase [Chitinophagaceae bacterium]|nr:HAD-IIIC family phosphatase [Chitinophagaceae bacterium]
MEFLQLKKNLKNDFSNLPVKKIAVLADSASQFLCQALKGYGYTQGMHLDIWEADYNQIYQTVLDEDSKLYTTKPDFVIIFQSSKKLLSGFYETDKKERKNWAENQKNYIETILNKVSSSSNSNIIYLNFPEINDAVFGNFANKTDSSFLFQLRLLNVELMKLAANKKNLNICDLSAIQNTYGSIAVTDEKIYMLSDSVLAFDILPLVAKSITDIILSYSGRFKKCLILDLDNTLWGGVIGDDGIEGIQIGDLGIGKAFSRFQAWIKQLKGRGIILVACSKNTEHIAKEPFEKHPDMIVRLNDFALFVANWDNKPDNIRYIQSILNIGFDSMVFLDDNPFEREMVKKEIPDITVPDLPEDVAEYLPFLYQQNLFETTSFTEEDTKRNDQYREEAERTKTQYQFTNETEFLQSLQMTAEIRPVDKFTLPRAAQLTQRSNQFNLRTVRYTEEKLKEVLADDNKFTLAVSLNDKFGDYGLISLVILHKVNKADLFIDTWIMSCRVLKRSVEELVLNEVVEIANQNECRKILGEFIPTPKNELVKDHYKKLGFSENGKYWELIPGNYDYKKTFISKN